MPRPLFHLWISSGELFMHSSRFPKAHTLSWIAYFRFKEWNIDPFQLWAHLRCFACHLSIFWFKFNSLRPVLPIGDSSLSGYEWSSTNFTFQSLTNLRYLINLSISFWVVSQYDHCRRYLFCFRFESSDHGLSSCTAFNYVRVPLLFSCYFPP